MHLSGTYVHSEFDIRREGKGNCGSLNLVGYSCYLYQYPFFQNFKIAIQIFSFEYLFE